jgi:hypothetical protein
MEVRERHLRRRNQVEVPLACDLEQILLELRQVARPAQRLRVDQKRRLHLGVAMLARVQVEHEVDQAPRHACAGTHQHREPGARHLRCTLEVENPKGRSKIPVRPWFELEGPWLADSPHFHVVGRTRADRHARMGKIGQRHQHGRALLFYAVQLDLELPDLDAPRLVRHKDGGRIEPLAFRARNLVASGVLLALQTLELWNQPAPTGFKGNQLFELVVHFQPAAAHPRTHIVCMVTH